jgi:L,D-transpeptidase ErfK/SrfK
MEIRMKKEMARLFARNRTPEKDRPSETGAKVVKMETLPASRNRLPFRLPLAAAVAAACLAAQLTRPAAAADGHYYTSYIQRYPYNLEDNTVVGSARWHQVQPGETLLDIARRYGMGYNEVTLVYPRLDPWMPPKEKRLLIPALWVLPPTRHEELVINVAELRLFYFDKKERTVQTYPIGIGDEGWETPLGTCTISEKRANPTWYIPKSLQEKYGRTTMPPGPENPLGEFFMKLSIGPYGIHGTHMPWGVGRLISHGCIRLYPEHIRLLFPQVPLGTRLEIIYEPVKIGRSNEQIYVEAHPDVYKRFADFEAHARSLLEASSWRDQVDMDRYLLAVRLQNGVPTNVTRLHENAEGPPLNIFLQW